MDEKDPRLAPEALLMVGDTPDPFTIEAHLIMAVMKIAERDHQALVLERKLLTDAAQAAESMIEVILSGASGRVLNTFLPNGDGA